MNAVFASTTALLAAEFVEKFSGDRLNFALSKVMQKTGVKINRRNKTVCIAGQWAWVLESHQLLLDEVRHLDDMSYYTLSDEFGPVSCNNPGLLNTDTNSALDTVLEPELPNEETRQAFVGQNSHHKQTPDETLKAVNNAMSWNRSAADEVVKSIENSIRETENAPYDIFKNTNIEKNSNTEVKLEKLNEYNSAYDDDTDVETEVIEEHSTESKSFGTSDVNKINRTKTVAETSSIERETQNCIPPDDIIIKQDPDALQVEESSVITHVQENLNFDKTGFPCDECGYVGNKTSLKAHKRRRHSKKFKCDQCDKSFGYNKDLNRHKHTVHAAGKIRKTRGRKKKPVPIQNTTETFACDQDDCTYIGKTISLLKEHKKRQHRPRFKCEDCGRTFGFNKDLNRHKRRVHSAPEYFCEECNRFYKSKRSYDDHIKCHEADYVKPLFECDVCRKKFSTKYVLASHVKAEHLGLKKSYVCPLCGQNFTQKNSLRQHAAVHTGVRPYVCDICGKAFSYENVLRGHRLLHEQHIRRYQCEVCEKKFIQSGGLRVHMAVHQETRDYMCTACGKSFTQKGALIRHERIHTGDKPYSCHLCNKAFSDLSILRRHMILIHKRDPKKWQEGVIKNVRKEKYYFIDIGSNHDNSTPMGNMEAESAITGEQTGIFEDSFSKLTS